MEVKMKKKTIFFLMLFFIAFIGIGSEADGKTYKVVLDSTYAPFEFQNTDGTYSGIDVDLLDEISKTEGFTIQKSFPGFQAAVDQVQSGQADAIIAGMSITDERKKSFTFSDPYFDSSIEFAVKKGDNSTKKIEDLKGKVVGVKNGTVSLDFLNENKDKYGFTIKIFDEGAQMYDALSIGQVQAIMDDGPVVDYAVAQGKELATPIPATPIGHYGFAVKKGQNEELVKYFNEGLRKLKANGGYDKILNKYIGKDAGYKEPKQVDESTYSGLLQNNWQSLLSGLGNTLVMALLSFAFAMVIGIIFGLFSVSPIKALRILSTIYVDVIRGVPLMVLAVFIFYGLPQFLPFFKLNDFVAGIFALTLNASAYIAEIVRGGINAVPAGQMEASRSLGLGYLPTMQKIILPQAIRIMVPSFVNQFVISLKDTTIISVLGVIELLQAGKIIVGRNLQIFKV
jgi:polar amino acid transport system substrate-binding protein